MKIPYSQLELKMALFSLDENKLTEERMENFKKENHDLIDGAVTASTVAKFHGIKTEELINSVNYDKLEEKYKIHMTEELINRLTSQLDLTNKEAWAFFLVAIDSPLLT